MVGVVEVGGMNSNLRMITTFYRHSLSTAVIST